MKITRIETGIEQSGIWCGRVVVRVICSKDVNVVTNVNVVIEQIRKIRKNPRYVVIEGDVLIPDNRIDLFKLVQYLGSWYKTRGLEKVLIRCDGVADISNFLCNSLKSREHVVFELSYNRGFSKKNILENRFRVSDHIAFDVDNEMRLNDLFTFLQIISDDFEQRPICVIKIKDHSLYAAACKIVNSWVAINEIFDIRTIKI